MERTAHFFVAVRRPQMIRGASRWPGAARRCLDCLDRIVNFLAEPRRETFGNWQIADFKFPNITRKLGMKKHGHFKAARYCSSVNPCVRPVAISSIRRMPSRTASFKGSGATTLSTKRRANSSLSSGGRSKGPVVIILKQYRRSRHKATWDSSRSSAENRPSLSKRFTTEV